MGNSSGAHDGRPRGRRTGDTFPQSGTSTMWMRQHRSSRQPPASRDRSPKPSCSPCSPRTEAPARLIRQRTSCCTQATSGPLRATGPDTTARLHEHWHSSSGQSVLKQAPFNQVRSVTPFFGWSSSYGLCCWRGLARSTMKMCTSACWSSVRSNFEFGQTIRLIPQEDEPQRVGELISEFLAASSVTR